MARIPTHRAPTRPGEFLGEFIEDLGISQAEEHVLADIQPSGA